ncbi:Ribonuclease P protein subunit p25-like protein [Camellia lanceoleosa]|uniref:Ribonuclease P protein subunit p25-like protein n=1 Tax=Camellia lanceoleosa TaxID=1840588 RepID=A0ACC0HS93_9ERIC|nr:Ribonuclease P protein subunit p25-like protein [Camellia lanceoleosa]
MEVQSSVSEYGSKTLVVENLNRGNSVLGSSELGLNIVKNSSWRIIRQRKSVGAGNRRRIKWRQASWENNSCKSNKFESVSITGNGEHLVDDCGRNANTKPARTDNVTEMDWVGKLADGQLVNRNWDMSSKDSDVGNVIVIDAYAAVLMELQEKGIHGDDVGDSSYVFSSVCSEDMDRYQRVEKPRAETPIDENEIRITSQGRMRSYISYAMSLLQEKGSTEVVFKAMGRAINKTVTIVELIKRRIVGLHQITSIGSTDITDTWEPLEEGLLPLETTRHVSMITISLSKEELNTSSVGYQSPLPADQVKTSTEFDYEGEGSPTGRGRGRGGRGRGRSRAPYGNGFAAPEYEDGGWDRNRGYARGRGRGRGRNFRGRGRGGYNGPQIDNQQDAGHYNQEGPAPGRGRGHGRGYRGRGRGFRSNGLIHAAVAVGGA